MTDVGNPEDRLIEECAELIEAITKVKRFGWYSNHLIHPNRTNLENVKHKMDDVVEAIEKLSVRMRFITFLYHIEDPPK